MKIVLEKLKIRSISKKMLKIALQKMNSSLLEHSGKIEKQKQTQKSVKKKTLPRYPLDKRLLYKTNRE